MDVQELFVVDAACLLLKRKSIKIMKATQTACWSRRIHNNHAREAGHLEIVEGPVHQRSVLCECGGQGVPRHSMQHVPACVAPEERVHQHRAQVLQEKNQLVANLHPNWQQ